MKPNDGHRQEGSLWQCQGLHLGGKGVKLDGDFLSFFFWGFGLGLWGKSRVRTRIYAE